MILTLMLGIRLQSLFYIPGFLWIQLSVFFFLYSRISMIKFIYDALPNQKKNGASGALFVASRSRVASIIGACKMCTPATALSRHRLHCTFAFAAVPKPRVSASAVDWRSLLCTAPASLLIHLRYHAAYTPRVFVNPAAKDLQQDRTNENCHRNISIY